MHLKSGESDYSGTTTVSSGATLYAEAGTLGDTARLTTASGAHTYIEGNNEVRGFTLASGGVLAIGPTDTTGTGSDVTLTILSSTDDTTPDEQINHLCGELHGQGDLKVVGNGQVDEGVDADLTIHGSQTSFFGDLVLESGAWVDIEANDYGLFGNSTAKNEVVVSEDSLLTIESTQTGDALFYGVFRNGKKTDGTQAGGTVEITLAGATDQFHFAADQADAGFNGAFVLNRGTIDFTNLFTSTGAKAIRSSRPRSCSRTTVSSTSWATAPERVLRTNASSAASPWRAARSKPGLSATKKARVLSTQRSTSAVRAL